MKIFPIIRPAVGLKDILTSSFRNREHDLRNFAAFMALSTGNRSVHLVNSGLAAFYLILNALKERSKLQEVVLPAYTAGSLIVAVKKAGLKPVLCDISLDDFNLDRKLLPLSLSENTLAVVAVHSFGIPIADIAGMKNNIPAGACLIEDCCQAQASKVDGLPVGRFGDVSFFSFNRGKNFSLFTGGCVATNQQLISASIKEWLSASQGPGAARELFLALKMALSILATDPYSYGLVYPLIARFKENSPPDDFDIDRLSGLAAALGAALCVSRQDIFQSRNKNGAYLAEGLKNVPGLRLPVIAENCYPVYNRLPVLFDDVKAMKDKMKELWRAGFEVSRMYLQPLHVMFELGYKQEEFPNAGYLSQHLLTLPVYPALKDKDLGRMIEVLRS